MLTDVLRNMESGSLQRTFKWFREHCMSVCVCVCTGECECDFVYECVCLLFFIEAWLTHSAALVSDVQQSD